MVDNSETLSVTTFEDVSAFSNKLAPKNAHRKRAMRERWGEKEGKPEYASEEMSTRPYQDAGGCRYGVRGLWAEGSIHGEGEKKKNTARSDNPRRTLRENVVDD
ncbi:hypothetical protein MRX96_055606 [Rhipicephalus microplus]